MLFIQIQAHQSFSKTTLYCFSLFVVAKGETFYDCNNEMIKFCWYPYMPYLYAGLAITSKMKRLNDTMNSAPDL